MSEFLRTLPRYRSHKVVSALQIEHIISVPRGSELHFADKRYCPHLVSEEWMVKHEPREGGYLVVYQDGYQSWSPAEAFEEGYSLICDDGELDQSPCGKCGQVSHGQSGEYPCSDCGLPLTHDRCPGCGETDYGQHGEHPYSVCGTPQACLGAGCERPATDQHSIECQFEHFMAYSGHGDNEECKAMLALVKELREALQESMTVPSEHVGLDAERHCSDERPCIPCFTGQGKCEG